MGLLAPLYALAALAVVGPIVFHLIRREPKGKKSFSSLMFLQPSPPRLTRRSRLDNWLLLLLRMLAIAVIAIAFARPYLRQESLTNLDLSGRTIVLLIDTSASMQRTDVWQRALEEAGDVVKSLSNKDRLALYTIDEQLKPQIPLENGQATDPAALQQAVLQAITELEPSWHATDLAEGLTAVSDLLNAARISGTTTSDTTEIVLISDLHTDSGIEGLQGYEWPENTTLDVRRILPTTLGNARASLMASDDLADEDASQVRIRIENNADSDFDAFALAWTDASGLADDDQALKATTVQVPPGQVRVVPMPSQPAGKDRIIMAGDPWEADNQVFVIATEPIVDQIALVVASTAERKVEDDFGYFLTQAPLSSQRVKRDVVRVPASDLPGVLEDPNFGTLVLEPAALAGVSVESLRVFARDGGHIIVCLAEPPTNTDETSRLLAELWKIDSVEITERQVDDYGLIGWVDYTHPVFSPFADPRFNDFSKIRIWTHRKLQFDPAAAEEANLRIVAKFDDESPMLIEQTLDQGKIWLLTTGWQPSSSSLALSSKFIPILSGMIGANDAGGAQPPAVAVGAPVPLAIEPLQVSLTGGTDAGDDAWRFSNGKITFERPGLYRLQLNGEPSQMTIAVDVPATESRLVPLDADTFEQYGVQLGAVTGNDERLADARQMQIEELEKSQRLWQWLLALGLTILAVETLVAGWMTRSRTRRVAAAA